MKTTKYTLFYYAFIFSLFTFSLTFAQMTVKDGDDNTLLQVNDYGASGTVTLPPFTGILPTLPIDNQMLYNFDGTLYFNGLALGTSNNAGGWTRPITGGKIYTSDLTDMVFIGTNSSSTPTATPELYVYGSALFRKDFAGLEIDPRNTNVALRYYDNTNGGVDRIRIYSDGVQLIGNIGIGTSTPLSKLSVGGDGNSSAAISGVETNGRGVFGEANSGWGIHGLSVTGRGVFGEATNSSGYAGYFSGRGYFSGNIGIGETSPAYQLHVKDDQSNNFVARIENTSIGTNGDGLAILIKADIPGSGNHFIRFQKTGGASVASITGNGSGGVLYNTTSDGRLKMNIEEYSNALETVSQIGIKKYERIANPGTKEIGVIAQELQKVYPQAVSGSPDSDVKTDPMMVDYSKLTPLLVKGIQEQQKLIEELKKEVQELQREISNKRFTSVSK